MQYGVGQNGLNLKIDRIHMYYLDLLKITQENIKIKLKLEIEL